METYRDIKGFEGYYQVSNLGNVKSLDRLVSHPNGGLAFRKGQSLKKIFDKDSYEIVNLKIKQKGTYSRVHRLVAFAFLENKEQKPTVNHINGIKYDNRLCNLEWSTLSENRQHAYNTGLQNSFTRQGEKNNFAKLTKEKVIEIRKSNLSQNKLALIYNVTQTCISSIFRRKTWKHVL